MYHKDAIDNIIKITPAIAQGLFNGLRSPLFDENGMANKTMPPNNGPKAITYDSKSRGVCIVILECFIFELKS